MSAQGAPIGSPQGAGLTFSVVVPTYRSDKLVDCLDALASQTHPPLEVLVAARVDDRETRENLAGHPRPGVRIVDVDGGYIAGINAGLAAAQGDFVAFTDDDAVPRPDWLAGLAAPFARDPQVGGVGGRDVQPGDGGPSEPIVGIVSRSGRLLGNHHRGVGPAREVHILKGVNMAYRRAAIGDLRFDERLLGEGMQQNGEIRFCLMLGQRGWKLIYDPEILVDHYPGSRPDGALRQSADYRGIFNDCHNEMLALVSGLAGLRRVLTAGYTLLVGTRQHPGPLLALERLMAERNGGPLGRMRAATAGRLQALRTARKRPIEVTIPRPPAVTE